jgi:lysophospholipase L1-like esterase
VNVARAAARVGAAAAATLAAELLMAVLWPAPPLDPFPCDGRVGPDEGDPVRMTVVGDSSCTGTGVDRHEEVWILLVAHRLSRHTGRPVEIVSFAEGGARSGDVLATQIRPAVASRPDLVVVSVGANDVLKGVRMGTLADNLDAIVQRLAACGVPVIVSGVGDLGTIPRLLPPLRQLVTRRARRADQVHADVADRHGAVKAVQWGDARLQFRTRTDIWSADRLHPNGRGHAIWAETAWKVVEPVTAGLRPPG